MNANKKDAGRYVVVAAVDTSEASSTVGARAVELARNFEGAEIHLVHVIDPIQPAPVAGVPGPWDASFVIEQGRKFLENVGSAISSTFTGRIVAHLASGDPWREVVQFAESLEADLIVIGSHGRTGVKRLALGSVSELVVRRAKCPVYVVRPKQYTDADVPEIEPACKDCLEKQRATGGATLWCDRHAARHPKARLNYELPQSFGLGSGLLRP